MIVLKKAAKKPPLVITDGSRAMGFLYNRSFKYIIGNYLTILGREGRDMEKADTVFHENMRVMVSVSQAESTLRNGAADFLARYGGKVFDVERVEMRGCSCGTNNGSHHDNCLIALGGKQKVWLKGVKNPFSCDLLLAVPK